MIESKNWYAVYTKPRWEKKVATLLTRDKIENYCPLNKVQRQWSDRKKIVLEPLFTSYVFVRVAETEHSLLKKTDGVINMVYWLGKPAVIRDNEIGMIKSFLEEYTNVKLEKTPININDRVRIVSGPLMDMEGQVMVLKNKSVKIILPSLGYMMHAEVESDNIKVIDSGVLRNYELSNS
jgi:transcription antitermination factor NusG